MRIRPFHIEYALLFPKELDGTDGGVDCPLLYRFGRTAEKIPLLRRAQNRIDGGGVGPPIYTGV